MSKIFMILYQMSLLLLLWLAYSVRAIGFFTFILWYILFISCCYLFVYLEKNNVFILIDRKN